MKKQKEINLDTKKELSVSDVNEALAKAFAEVSRKKLDNVQDALMFGVIIGGEIAHRVIKELFEIEGE